jgi:hypothetical protein
MPERDIEPLNYSVAYDGPCPRCGADLDGPDHNLDRRCHACGITVVHATITFELIPDIPSSTPCDGCGSPASWLIDDGQGHARTLCDTCYNDEHEQSDRVEGID